MCAQSNGTLLSRVPGFEQISPVWYPEKLAEQFALIAGVEEERYYEDDEGNYVDALRKVNAEAANGGTVPD
jgi:hypothetical protein